MGKSILSELGCCLKFLLLGAVQKCSDARRAKNRTVRRIVTYVERCGLQRNAADERFSTTPLAVIATLIIAAFLTVLLLTVGFDLAAGIYGRQPHPSQAAGKK